MDKAQADRIEAMLVELLDIARRKKDPPITADSGGTGNGPPPNKP